MTFCLSRFERRTSLRPSIGIPFCFRPTGATGGAGPGSLPDVAFLHGNVLVGVCFTQTGCVACVAAAAQNKCGSQFRPLPPALPSQTEGLRFRPLYRELNGIGFAVVCLSLYFLSIFGYSAPKTDVEARRLMLEVWQENHHLDLAEVEIIDI